MKNGVKSGVEPLAEGEWKIENSTDDSTARGTFVYEYIRSSKKLTKLVEDCRQTARPVMTGVWTAEFRPLTRALRQLICQQANGGEPFERIIEALMNCPQFPNIPASELRDKSWLVELERAPAVRICGEAFDSTDMDHAVKQFFAEPGIEYRLNYCSRVREFESLVPLVIDWRNSNAKILEEFKEKILSSRIDKFRPLKKIPSSQNAFGNLCFKLPFRPIAALDWLGCYRRIEATGNDWKTFLHLYDEHTEARIEVGEIGYESWRQTQIRKRDKARLILEWFEAGAVKELRSEEFSKG